MCTANGKHVFFFLIFVVYEMNDYNKKILRGFCLFIIYLTICLLLFSKQWYKFGLNEEVLLTKLNQLIGKINK